MIRLEAMAGVPSDETLNKTASERNATKLEGLRMRNHSWVEGIG